MRLDPVFVFPEEKMYLSADEILMERQKKLNGYSEIDKAKKFLENLLSNGPVDAEDVLAVCANAGISVRTARRAKKDLSVQSNRHKDGKNGWYWVLPTLECQDGQESE